MKKVANLALTIAMSNLIGCVSCALEPMCQVKLGLGALTAMSKQSYNSIAYTLNNCPALIESTINVFKMDINFTTEITDPIGLINNIKAVQEIVTSIRPALEECSNVVPGMDFDAVDKVVHMITDPTTSELYSFSLKVVKKLPRINEETERAQKYWKVDKCAQGGYILGKLILEVQETEASTVEVIGIGADAAV